MRIPVILAAVLLGAALALIPQAAAEASGHGALASPGACARCHQADHQARWETHRDRPCTAFCVSCHTREAMGNHHSVGQRMEKQPRLALRLTVDRKSACFTCHDLSVRRFDTVRWKAESLYARMFRKETRYKTYYLVVRNDHGQLCLACH